MILAKCCTGVSVASGGVEHVKSMSHSERSGSAHRLSDLFLLN